MREDLSGTIKQIHREIDKLLVKAMNQSLHANVRKHAKDDAEALSKAVKILEAE